MRLTLIESPLFPLRCLSTSSLPTVLASATSDAAFAPPKPPTTSSTISISATIMRPDAAPIGGDVEVLRRYIGHCTFPERRSTKTTLHLPLNSSPMLSFPITPPADSESDDDRDGESVETDSQAHKILETATHVLATEANALLHLSRLYATDALARDGFLRAVEAIAESQEKDGKTIVIGVGKSGKIGDKLVASMNSLGLLTTFLNPTDALHGDLGIIRKVSYMIHPSCLCYCAVVLPSLCSGSPSCFPHPLLATVSCRTFVLS